MARQAISVTLETDNLTWLKGRAGAAGASVSAVLDQLVRRARQHGDHGHTRSVVGTIDISPADPGLETADEAVRDLFERSLRRPLVARERSPAYGVKRATRSKRGRTR
jgi:hypothetical protein